MATAVTLLGAASPGLAGDAGRDGGVAGHNASFQRSGLRPKKRRPQQWVLCSLKYGCLGVDPGELAAPGRTTASPVYSSLTISPAGEASVAIVSSEQKVYDVVLKQAALLRRQLRPQQATQPAREMVEAMPRGGLKEAYGRCGDICEEYAKTFYLGTLLMTEERRRAIWAIYVWCRRTDELVDGPNASHITPQALDRWEKRLEDLFAGRPYDMLDAALSDTIIKFPIDIQPFKDMIDGMRTDLKKARYNNFDELYMYCYYVAGTVGLMSVPVMGIDPESKATAESVYGAVAPASGHRRVHGGALGVRAPRGRPPPARRNRRGEAAPAPAQVPGVVAVVLAQEVRLAARHDSAGAQEGVPAGPDAPRPQERAVQHRRVPHVQLQGQALLPRLLPRLDRVPLRAPGRERAPPRPAPLLLQLRAMPGVPQGRVVQEGRRLRVRARGVRVLAPPGAVPDAPLQGRGRLRATHLLLRTQARRAPLRQPLRRLRRHDAARLTPLLASQRDGQHGDAQPGGLALVAGQPAQDGTGARLRPRDARARPVPAEAVRQGVQQRALAQGKLGRAQRRPRLAARRWFAR